MAIITYESSPIGKCVSCRHYSNDRGRHDWTSGKCVSETTKVRDRHRWYNSKVCASYCPMRDWFEQYEQVTEQSEVK